MWGCLRRDHKNKMDRQTRWQSWMQLWLGHGFGKCAASRVTRRKHQHQIVQNLSHVVSWHPQKLGSDAKMRKHTSPPPWNVTGLQCCVRDPSSSPKNLGLRGAVTLRSMWYCWQLRIPVVVIRHYAPKAKGPVFISKAVGSTLAGCDKQGERRPAARSLHSKKQKQNKAKTEKSVSWSSPSKQTRKSTVSNLLNTEA